MSKRQLYWIFQIIGWSLYGFIQLFLYSVEFQITLSFFSGQFISQNIIADFSKKDHIKITRKCEKFPFHRKILEDPIDQRDSLNKERYLIYNLLNGLLLAMKDYVEKNSIKKLFLGLSGGIDSAVVLFIASKIVSKENLTAIMMPSKFTSKASKETFIKFRGRL